MEIDQGNKLGATDSARRYQQADIIY